MSKEVKTIQMTRRRVRQLEKVASMLQYPQKVGLVLWNGREVLAYQSGIIDGFLDDHLHMIENEITAEIARLQKRISDWYKTPSTDAEPDPEPAEKPDESCQANQ